jgi:energy-coupling factor transporter transmembrane protein EcfT
MSSTVTFMVLSTFSSITSIKEKLNRVRESQRARGIETEGNLFVKVKSILPVLFPVIISSMTGIEDKTLAMDARAFAADGAHTSLRKIQPVKWSEKTVAVVAVVISILGCVAGKLFL